MTAKNYLVLGALLAALAIGAGAFGAHALKSIVSADVMQVFETANRYQFYHALALIMAAFFLLHFKVNAFNWACRLFLCGILIFSGSLYVLCFVKWKMLNHLFWIGAITPFGGLSFIVGWLLMARGFMKIK
jgi:uncharacterized membrane protein YgdD (TMEM256/DUF423 family)